MSDSPIKIAPSILAADFARLGEQVAVVEKLAEKFGIDRLHVDVMDGHFVPNISFGVPIIKSLRKVTKLPLETHLMIDAPDRYLEAFVEAGSTSLLVHVEGAHHLHRTIERIKQLGVKAGVVLNPATPLSTIEEILPDVDIVLATEANPGDTYAAVTSRSHHPRGVTALMMDGAVRFVDATTSPAVWRAQGTAAGGEFVGVARRFSRWRRRPPLADSDLHSLS